MMREGAPHITILSLPHVAKCAVYKYKVKNFFFKEYFALLTWVSTESKTT